MSKTVYNHHAMITLHQFRPFWGLPNASPFCMKAETYLRHAGIDYQTAVCDPRSSPSGQIPFVTTGEETISDSEGIIAHFEALRGNPLDAGLSESEKAQAWFMRSRVEDELYWQITYMRWGDPQGWKHFRPDLKQYLPGWKKLILPAMIRHMLLKQMRCRGMSPQDTAKSYAPGKAVLDELSRALGDKPYFLGDSMRSLDMSLYAFLANIIDQPHSNQLQTHARALANLSAYCQRMKAQIWANF